MHILVTGASGTLGGCVLRELLSAGHGVTAYGRSPPLVNGIKFIQGDIMQPEQLRVAGPGHDAIIHLAAVPGAGRATPEKSLHVNVVGTVNVLETAVAAGIPQVVFASSGAATGFSFQPHKIIPDYFPIDEDHPCSPQDEYCLGKLLAETTCTSIAPAGRHLVPAWTSRTGGPGHNAAHAVIRDVA